MVAEDENGQIRKHVESLTASEVLWDVRCEGSWEGRLRRFAFTQLSLCLAISFLCSVLFCGGAEF